MAAIDKLYITKSQWETMKDWWLSTEKQREIDNASIYHYIENNDFIPFSNDTSTRPIYNCGGNIRFLCWMAKYCPKKYTWCIEDVKERIGKLYKFAKHFDFTKESNIIVIYYNNYNELWLIDNNGDQINQFYVLGDYHAQEKIYQAYEKCFSWSNNKEVFVNYTFLGLNFTKTPFGLYLDLHHKTFLIDDIFMRINIKPPEFIMSNKLKDVLKYSEEQIIVSSYKRFYTLDDIKFDSNVKTLETKIKRTIFNLPNYIKQNFDFYD